MTGDRDAVRLVEQEPTARTGRKLDSRFASLMHMALAVFQIHFPLFIVTEVVLEVACCRVCLSRPHHTQNCLLCNTHQRQVGTVRAASELRASTAAAACAVRIHPSSCSTCIHGTIRRRTRSRSSACQLNSLTTRPFAVHTSTPFW